MRHSASVASLVVVALACTPNTRPALSPRDPAAREALLLTSHDLAPGRRCRIVDAEVPLPNVAALVDTAAVPEYLRQAGMAADTGYAVFSLRYDSTVPSHRPGPGSPLPTGQERIL